MGRPRKYSIEEKAAAVGLATSIGVTKAASVTQYPMQTISDWTRRDEWQPLRNQAHDIVAEHFWMAVQIGLAAVVQGLTDDAPLKDKALALATVYDRWALLTGGATARSEARDITGTISDAELVSALREAERLTTASGTSTQTAGEATE